jgi:hypothetical protein
VWQCLTVAGKGTKEKQLARKHDVEVEVEMNGIEVVSSLEVGSVVGRQPPMDNCWLLDLRGV